MDNTFFSLGVDEEDPKGGGKMLVEAVLGGATARVCNAGKIFSSYTFGMISNDPCRNSSPSLASTGKETDARPPGQPDDPQPVNGKQPRSRVGKPGRASEFTPVRIRGGLISDTVIEDRR